MIETLYSPFRKWTEKGTLWVYSDPHFSDPDMVALRKNYIGDNEQIARINSKVGKNDTIIFLGDIGNEELIRKIRGRKILIMGNHDKGASKYQRQILQTIRDRDCYTKEEICEEVSKKYPGWKIDIYEDYCVNCAPYSLWLVRADNCLFDEVYEGPLFIAEKLILSHEPINLPYAFNIHGHDHSNWHKGEHHLNVCAEHIDYTPVNVTRLIKKGLLSKVDSIHRMTIDRAVMRKDIRKFAEEIGDDTKRAILPKYPHGGSYEIVPHTVLIPTVAYLCDGKACGDCVSGDARYCFHTCDIRHALDFEEIEPGKFMQKKVRE